MVWWRLDARTYAGNHEAICASVAMAPLQLVLLLLGAFMALVELDMLLVPALIAPGMCCRGGCAPPR